MAQKYFVFTCVYLEFYSKSFSFAWFWETLWNFLRYLLSFAKISISPIANLIFDAVETPNWTLLNLLKKTNSKRFNILYFLKGIAKKNLTWVMSVYEDRTLICKINIFVSSSLLYSSFYFLKKEIVAKMKNEIFYCFSLELKENTRFIWIKRKYEELLISCEIYSSWIVIFFWFR